jgi:1,2-diacylglycerol 3-alpha-glucosyltransferase
MKILIVNPILYTCESKRIYKQDSIKDTMIFGLCREFSRQGYEVTLYACQDYMPLHEDKANFKIVYERPFLRNVFHPNNFPVLPHLKHYLKQHLFDYIICSESFSTSTYTCVKLFPKRTIIWQELAEFQKAFFRIPAWFWYTYIVKRKYQDVLIVPRSKKAQTFISQFSNHVSDSIIDHGVDTLVFHPLPKEKQFIIVGQLIKRKQVNKSVEAFLNFCEKADSSYLLKIAGDGDQLPALAEQVKVSKFSNRVVFLGKLDHSFLAKEMSKSMAMLIYTKQDNNMISIVESLACGTPIITTSVPFHASLIKEKNLGIVKDNWNWEDLVAFLAQKDTFLANCNKESCSFGYFNKVLQFSMLFQQEMGSKQHVED